MTEISSILSTVKKQTWWKESGFPGANIDPSRASIRLIASGHTAFTTKSNPLIPALCSPNISKSLATNLPDVMLIICVQWRGTNSRILLYRSHRPCDESAVNIFSLITWGYYYQHIINIINTSSFIIWIISVLSDQYVVVQFYPFMV